VDTQPHKLAHLTPDPAPQEPPLVPARTGAKRFAIDLTPLRISREFRLLFIGQSVSYFGGMASFVVLPWQMYQLTQSSFAVGMLGATEFLPIITMAFIGGALADYTDRRRMVRLAELLAVLAAAALVINSLLAHPKVWVLFVCAGSFAALSGLKRPSLEALKPRLVPPELQPAIAALGSMGGSVGSIVGPALGGFIAGTAGATVAYLLTLSMYALSLVTLWLMRAVPPPSAAERPGLRSIMEGLRYAISRRELLGTYLIDMNAMFFGMPMALFPAIAERFGHASVGFLYAAPSMGALLATLSSGWAARVNRHGLAVTIAAGLWGVAIIFFGFAGTLWLGIFWLIVAGAADMVSGIFRMTIWNQTIPDHLRGRLAGIEMVSYMSGPLLGNAEAGIVASLFSIRTSVVSGGILCVAGTGLLAMALPSFLRYDGRQGVLRKRMEEAARKAETAVST